MAAADLPPEIWAVIALIAGLMVIMCLAVLASTHGHLMKVQKLARDVGDLRKAYSAAFKSVEFVDDPLGSPPGRGAKEVSARKAA